MDSVMKPRYDEIDKMDAHNRKGNLLYRSMRLAQSKRYVCLL